MKEEPCMTVARPEAFTRSYLVTMQKYLRVIERSATAVPERRQQGSMAAWWTPLAMLCPQDAQAHLTKVRDDM